MEEDAGSVRAEAAVAAAARGQLGKVTEGLLEQVHSNGGSAAMAAFVAVADEVGLPEDVGSYPTLTVGVALAQRRWREDKTLILKQSGKAAIGGAIAMALVANLQIIPSIWITPEAIDQYLEFTTIPMWILSNALIGLMWGGILGAGMGFLVGLADSLWRGRSKGRWHLVFGGLAGLIHAFFLVMMSASGGLAPTADAAIYAPVYLLYGLLIGGVLSNVIPVLGQSFPFRKQVLKSLGISLVLTFLAAPTVYVIYRERMLSALILHFLVAVLFPLGLVGALSGKTSKGVVRQGQIESSLNESVP
jgi:hypothetical protein